MKTLFTLPTCPGGDATALAGCRSGRSAMLPALVLWVVASVCRAEGPGGLDPTFTASANGGYGSVYAMAVQPDGKILLGGEFTQVNGQARNGFARLNADGSLDAGFDAGNDGQGCRAFALLRDGQILVQNYIPYRMSVVRLRADGRRDPAFHVVSVDDDNPLCLVPLEGGKILLGGYFRAVNGIARDNLVRLNADGSLDVSFPDLTVSSTRAMARQSDGKVIVGGSISQVNGVAHHGIARLLADGGLDATFNASSDGSVQAMAVQGDGKIILSGYFTQVNGVACPNLTRLNPDGSLDTAFNAGLSGYGTQSLAVQPDGKILLGGSFGWFNGTMQRCIARLNADGTPDPTLNADANREVRAVATQADGKILLGGSFNTINGTPRFSIARLKGETAADVCSVVGNPGQGGFVVSRSGKLAMPLNVLYHHGGSAVDGVDYERLPGVITLSAGQSEAVISVNLLSGANRNRKVKVFLDPIPSGAYEIGKAQSKVFLSALP